MSELQLPSASITLRIPFNDVDPMQVVWHGNYFRYMEQVRCELLRQIDYGYREMEASGFAWPIIDTRMKPVLACDVLCSLCGSRDHRLYRALQAAGIDMTEQPRDAAVRVLAGVCRALGEPCADARCTL